MAKQNNSGGRAQASTGSQNGRNRANRTHEQHSGKLTKFAAIGGLVLSVGSVLYRLRRRWIPKAEELAVGGRDRVKRVRHVRKMDKKADSSSNSEGDGNGQANHQQIP